MTGSQSNTVYPKALEVKSSESILIVIVMPLTGEIGTAAVLNEMVPVEESNMSVSVSEPRPENVYYVE